MKKLFLAALVAFSPVVLAPHAAKAQTGLGVGISGSQSGAAAQAISGIQINNPGFVQTKQKGRVDTTANALAPALAASAVNTCLGSWSLGVGVTGLGLSGGSTYLENHCEARLTATLLAQMGAKPAAVNALCANPIAYDALTASGYRCPFGKGNHFAAQPAVQPVAVAARPAQPYTAPGRVYTATPWRD